MYEVLRRNRKFQYYLKNSKNKESIYILPNCFNFQEQIPLSQKIPKLPEEFKEKRIHLYFNFQELIPLSSKTLIISTSKPLECNKKSFVSQKTKTNRN